MVGQNIGKYRVLDRIGRGGMGTVYRAVDETLHRDVAIKVLNAELNDPEIAKRFRAEAITVARLSHPGIATIYELFQHDGQWLMVMEFVGGETLEHLAVRSGPLAPERAGELCMQALAALAHAHSMGVVHRDLKPANLMLTQAGTVKVMDFGIARVAGTEHLTSAGFMMGTPAYMAPEQVMGKEIDARADLYALGVVFYRLLAGRLPFAGDTPFAMAQSQVNDAPAPIGSVRPGLPDWVEQVLSRALAKGPEERFQSAVEFHEALARCLDGLPLPAPYSSSAPTEMLRTPIRPMPTGSVGKVTPPSIPPLTARSIDVTAPVSTPVSAELEATVLGPKVSPVPEGHAETVATPVPSAVPIVHGAAEVSAAAEVPAAPAAAPAPKPAAPPAKTPPGRPVPAAPARPAGTAPSASRQSSMPMLAIAGVAIVLLLGGGAWFLSRPADSDVTQPDSPTAEAIVAPEPAQPASPPPVEDVPPAEALATPPAPAAETPAPDVAGPPQAAPKPAPARTARARGDAGRSAGPVAPAETPLTIEGGRLVVVTDRNRTRDQEASLNFADGQLSITARQGGALLAAMPYTSIARATYLKARDPKWDAALPGPPQDIDVGGILRTSKHWIVLQATDRYLILRLEDSNWRRVFDTIRLRANVTFSLPASTDKD